MVAKAVGILSTIGATITQSIQSIKDETLATVEQKRAEQGAAPPSPPASGAPVAAQDTVVIPPAVGDLPSTIPSETPQAI